MHPLKIAPAYPQYLEKCVKGVRVGGGEGDARANLDMGKLCQIMCMRIYIEICVFLFSVFFSFIFAASNHCHLKKNLLQGISWHKEWQEEPLHVYKTTTGNSIIR